MIQTWFKGKSNLIQMWVKLDGNVIQMWFKRDFYCILRMLSISKSSFLAALAWNEFQACYTTMGVAEVNRRSPFVLREATIDTRCWEWLMVHIRVFGSPNVCRDNPNCELDLPIWKIKKYSIVLLHGVWKSQKKSHSTLRAKRATFTFWKDKS